MINNVLFVRLLNLNFLYVKTTLALIYVVVVLVILNAKVYAGGLRVLVLNDVNDPPFTTAAGDGFLDVIAGEAFRRSGVKLKLVKLPAERGLINANSGIEDGDMVRIAGLEKLYPNLIRVPEKLIDFEFAAYSKNPDISVSQKTIRSHVVGHVTGWKIYEHYLEGAEHIVTANDPEQLFLLLARDRAEVVLYACWMGEARIKKLNLKGIHLLKPLVAKRAMFIYLNKRHRELVPRIAKAIRDLKREGFYEKVRREKLEPYRVK